MTVDTIADMLLDGKTHVLGEPCQEYAYIYSTGKLNQLNIQIQIRPNQPTNQPKPKQTNKQPPNKQTKLN